MGQGVCRCRLRPPTSRFLALVAALLFWLAAVAPTYAQAPLNLIEYRQLLADSQAIVADLGPLSPEAQDSILARLAERWESVTAVTLPNNEQTAVNNAFILEQLRARPADSIALQGLFAEMATAVEQWPDPRHTPGDTAPLAEILTRPEFNWQEPEPTWRDRLWEWALTNLFNLLEWLFGRGELANFSWLNWLLTIGGFLLLLGAVIYALRGLRASLTADVNTDVDGHLAHEAISADEALRRAQAFSSEGDQRLAVRYLYLSALLMLEERGLLRYDRSQTNREYLRSVAHRPDLATILQEVVEVFDRVWYGFQPIEEADVTHYTARVGELRRLQASRPSQPANRRDNAAL
jgi:hypothetical protein